jgi:hypothetical protein
MFIEHTSGSYPVVDESTVPVISLKLCVIIPTRAQVTNKRILIRDKHVDCEMSEVTVTHTSHIATFYANNVLLNLNHRITLILMYSLGLLEHWIVGLTLPWSTNVCSCSLLCSEGPSPFARECSYLSH